MKIYDTKGLAMEAAEALLLLLRHAGQYKIDTLTHDYIAVEVVDSGYLLAEFHYKPERVAPAMGQAVIGFTSELGTEVLAVLNGLRNTHGKACAGMKLDGDACSSTALASYTPVDIIPAGQFAKAVELLERYVIAHFVAPVDLGDAICKLKSETQKLLDKIKAGGE